MKKRFLVLMTVVLLLSMMLVSTAGAASLVQTKEERMMREAVDLKLQELCCDGGLKSFTRKNLVDDIYEYSVVLKVGTGEFDRIGLHRVVKEKKPWIPVKTKKASLLWRIGRRLYIYRTSSVQ